MKPLSKPVAGLLLLTIMGVALALAWPGAKPKTQNAAPAAPSAVATAGLKVYLDPVTHRIAPPPAGLAPNPAEQKMFNSSHEGLVEEPGTTAAGGFKVDLRGRFQSAVSVQVGPDGKPVVDHSNPPSAR